MIKTPKIVLETALQDDNKENSQNPKLTKLLLGADLPSQSSGSSFVESHPNSARSSLQSIDIRFANRLLGPGTSELESVSDTLTLNFIFDEAFRSANLSSEASLTIETKLPPPDDSEVLALARGASSASCNSFNATRKLIRSMATDTLMDEILREMMLTPVLFMPRSTLNQNVMFLVQEKRDRNRQVMETGLIVLLLAEELIAMDF
ncbi:hypothetical protein FBU30_001983 [Linnemannia zychae]|nr:hypothetical protein FBU30_001983 [Linnemannia zychae]